jgi:pimeloyl-ACP methyl ester carboxylesterase
MNEVLSQSIDGRELIELDGSGVCVRGTLHTGGNASTRDRIGIVFLNSLSIPRTATGDSAVFWAERFSHLGFPCLRLDLPGLGDSGGTIPTELLNYINAGEYASITAASVKEMIDRFGFSGVVLVGHCAGAVTAVYAAAACPDQCKGLVLLDPYFHLPQAVRPMLRRGLSAWAMQSRFGGIISNVYDGVRGLRRLLRGNAVPGNANKKLLQCWKKLAPTGIPILLFKAPARKAAGIKPRAGEFDYLSHVLQIAGSGSRVVVKLIERTDHSFANRAGRAAVAQVTERWLQTSVRTSQPEGVEGKAPDSITGEQSNYNHYQLDCLRN